MNIKKSSATLFAVILACVIGSAPLHAQTAAASQSESDTNTATAQTGSSPADSNSMSAAKANHENSSDGAPGIANDGTQAGNQWDQGENHNRTIVPLASKISPFIMAVTIILIVYYFRHRRNKMVHETLRAMIEKGLPITPELLAGLGGKNSFSGNPFDQLFPGRQQGRNRHLLPGLILIGVGLALTGFQPEHSGPGSLIILFIGLAFLIVWIVERKQNVNDNKKREDSQQPPKV